MSEYYFNEKKGRYEPKKQAPFGIAPKEKIDRKVFSADNYMEEAKEKFPSRYKEEASDTRFDPLTNTVENWVNKAAEAISEVGENTSQTHQGTSTQSSQGSPFAPYKSTTSKKKTSQKGKSSIGMIIGIVWFLLIVTKACGD